MLDAVDIHVTGIVQGVGFRPFVYRLAKKYLINGWVLNATDGVFIHAEGESKLVDEFTLELADNPPAASKVEQVDITEVPLEDFDSFEIRFSDTADVEKTTLVSPDLATCDDCVRELFDPADRRYHYPFINCTNCGPRFTIIRGLPYDRAKTSMADFPMCDACATEYKDPLDHRFHAQPDACFECGPSLCFADLSDNAPSSAVGVRDAPAVEGMQDDSGFSWAHDRGSSDAIIDRAVDLLRGGKIVAVKGLGGFHLVCDAQNADALARLRVRKRREGKAFAVMVADVPAARQWCRVSVEEEALMKSPARPIVLLRKRDDAQLAAGLADGLPELGVMLPATPLQHLLMHAYGSGMLVMTSGNVHDEPIQTDDVEACRALAGIADALVGNNRAILSRYDDSVVRVIAAGSAGPAVQMIRRARGYAPLPIALYCPSSNDVDAEGSSDQEASSGSADAASQTVHPDVSIFATGPEQKNTFCITRPKEAFVSQHIGDMENTATFDAWLHAKDTYCRLFELKPQIIVHDLHPEYLTSKWAAKQPQPAFQVQHHHAHIVSAMAENKLEGPVCGIAFDGTGYGADGAIWGGEVLLSNLRTYERFGNFAYFPLPGGAAAIKNPLRCAYGALWAFDLLEHPAAQEALAALGGQAEVCAQMIDKGINCPQTSSVGRLFDAASALLGTCVHPAYEGQAAILLEAAISDGERIDDPQAYRIDIVKNTATDQSTALDTSVVLLDAAPAFRALLDDKQAGVPVSTIAIRFHNAFAQAIVQMAQLVQAAYDIRTVALSGGVFMNRHLIERVIPALEHEGFTVAINRDLPPNDACISYGQAVVGLANQD